MRNKKKPPTLLKEHKMLHPCQVLSHLADTQVPIPNDIRDLSSTLCKKPSLFFFAPAGLVVGVYVSLCGNFGLGEVGGPERRAHLSCLLWKSRWAVWFFTLVPAGESCHLGGRQLPHRQGVSCTITRKLFPISVEIWMKKMVDDDCIVQKCKTSARL